MLPSGSPKVSVERRSYLALCCAEPFRIFFPLGVLIGILGVSLWPLFFSGLHKFYPGVMHARLMIEGFMGAFVLGFLGTAGPRLTGTPHFAGWELGSLLSLLGGAVGLHLARWHFAGDLTYLALLLFFATRMARRFALRTDLPPPSFVLVAFGFGNAIAGVVSLLIAPLGDGSPRCVMLGSLLLYQGFVLYLVLGIGGFLLPRFLVLPPKPEVPESRDFSTAWTRRALLAASVGAVLFASFMIEVFAAAPRAAGVIRLVAATIFLGSEIPFHRSAAPRVTITRCLNLAVILLVLGLLFPILWPGQRVAGLHVVFVGGFTLIAFTVATRVVLGHSGQGHLFIEPLPFLRATAALLVVAAAFRVAGDFHLATRGTLLDTAAYLWMLAAAVWSWRVLPRVRIADPTQ